MRKAAAYFTLIIGCCMVLMWIFLLVSGNVRELVTEPARIAFQIFSELLTASLLVVAGIKMLRSTPAGRPVYFLATGALIYSLINAIGYYITFLSMPLVVLFTAITAASLFFLSICLVNERVNGR